MVSNPCRGEGLNLPYIKDPCVCEICNCGRHRCPHYPKQRLPWGPCVMSEYGAQYRPHCLDPVKPFKQEESDHTCNDPMANETTHRVDYKPNPICPPFHREKEKYCPPSQMLESSTTYRNEYTLKLCPPPEPMKPIEPCKCPAKFEGNPTYRTDYRPWDLPPIKRHQPDQYHPPNAPFNGLPFYRSDYTPKCDSRRTTMKPTSEIMISCDPLDGTTSYRQNYVPHPLPIKCGPEKPAAFRSKAPFDGMTTVMADYTPKQYCEQHLCKHENSIGLSCDPMSQMTTHRTDYTKHDLCPPARQPKDCYVKPQGDMEKNTSYRNDYPIRPMCNPVPVKICPPPTCPAPFEGDTNYRTDYKPWNVKPCIVKPDHKYVQSNVPMERLTTNRVAFVPQPLCPPKAFVPIRQAPDCGPFDGITSYRTDYTKKEILCCCPAASLSISNISPDGYVYQAEDPCGHQHYKIDGTPIAHTH